MTNDATMADNQDHKSGIGYGVLAFVLWGGAFPVLMKAVSHISVFEILAHRVIWSLPVVAVALVIQGKMRAVVASFKNPKTLFMGLLCAVLISCNWGIYIWAIAAGYGIESSMGYYITPLISILIGAGLLSEQLSKAQIVSVLLAAMAVLILAYDIGTVPYVALGLAATFGIYSYFRKTLPIGGNEGFMLEVVILLLPAILVFLWFTWTGTGKFLAGSTADILLLITCGIATATPLMLFANAAKLVRMSTLGILQFIVPTLIFLVAVFLFKEPFTSLKLVAFLLIWVAMALYGKSLMDQGR